LIQVKLPFPEEDGEDEEEYEDDEDDEDDEDEDGEDEGEEDEDEDEDEDEEEEEEEERPKKKQKHKPLGFGDTVRATRGLSVNRVGKIISKGESNRGRIRVFFAADKYNEACSVSYRKGSLALA
tara:strand:- start:3614 stop:3985 length:372 start_codon:yes stop_codon:yes gene_type:complete